MCMQRLVKRAKIKAGAEIALLDHKFHREIIRASGSQRLVMVLDNMVRTSIIYRNFQRYDQEALLRVRGRMID